MLTPLTFLFPSQALVYVSNTMSRGKFTELQGIVSNEVTNTLMIYMNTLIPGVLFSGAYVMCSGGRALRGLPRILTHKHVYLSSGAWPLASKVLSRAVWGHLTQHGAFTEITECTCIALVFVVCFYLLQMLNYVEKKCRALSDAQRQQLAVSVDDIIFMLPEDISVVFDKYGECGVFKR